MILMIIGAILAAVGGFLIYNRQFALNKSLEIRYQETTQVNVLKENYQATKAVIGDSAYNGGVVELKGIGRTDSPLYAEHSGQECLYYESIIERKYETTKTETDSNGNTRQVTSTETDVVSQSKQSTPFYLNDGTGEILIEPDNAKIEPIKSMERFERDMPSGLSISWGNTSRTLGYTYREYVVPQGARLYVLGEVSDRNGKLAIVKPGDKTKPFLVSTRSEEDIVKSADTSATWQLYGGIVAIVIGLVMLIAGAL